MQCILRTVYQHCFEFKQVLPKMLEKNFKKSVYIERFTWHTIPLLRHKVRIAFKICNTVQHFIFRTLRSAFYFFVRRQIKRQRGDRLMINVSWLRRIHSMGSRWPTSDLQLARVDISSFVPLWHQCLCPILEENLSSARICGQDVTACC